MSRRREVTDGHLTTFQAAKVLGMAVRSVQLLVNRNELVAWKTPGGHRRIPMAAIEAWLRDRPDCEKSTTDRALSMLADQKTASRPEMGAEEGMSLAMPVLLMVEDSAYYQSLVQMLVQRAVPTYELFVDSDGITGLATYGWVKPDIMIIDLMLPGIDGPTLIGAMRTNPAFQATQIIVVTSLSEEELQKHEKALAGLPVIFKTDLVRQLPIALRRALGTRRLATG